MSHHGTTLPPPPPLPGSQTCAGAQPRYLGQAPRGAVWQQPKQLTAEQLRWTSYWWQSHRQQNQRARGKWVCPEAGPALYARDARGAATRWKLTLRSAGAPTILSVSQTTTTPSVIRVVVAKAPGPGEPQGAAAPTSAGQLAGVQPAAPACLAQAWLTMHALCPCLPSQASSSTGWWAPPPRALPSRQPAMP